MKILQILVLILGLSFVINAQSVNRTTTLKGTIFNQAGGVITDVWITIKSVNGKGFTFQPRYGPYRTQILPGTYSIEVNYKKSQLYEMYKIENYEVPLAKEITLDITLRTGKKFRDDYEHLLNNNKSTDSKSKRKNIQRKNNK